METFTLFWAHVFLASAPFLNHPFIPSARRPAIFAYSPLFLLMATSNVSIQSPNLTQYVDRILVILKVLSSDCHNETNNKHGEVLAL